MKAEFRIRRQIIQNAANCEYYKDRFDFSPYLSLETEESIKEAWEVIADVGLIQDIAEEFRQSGIETGIECDWSRHYESESVATKLDDGTWVGWTYWHGGGKHSDPAGICWLEEAYDLNVEEEEKLVVVRKFSKKQI